MAERRTAPRVEPPRPLSARVKTTLAARVVDISAKGVQLELTASLRPEVPCDLRLALEEGEVVVRGVVRRCRAWGFGLDEKDRKALMYRAGLEFVEAPPEALAAMVGALLGVRGSTSSPAVPGQPPGGDGSVRIRVKSSDVKATPRPPRERR